MRKYFLAFLPLHMPPPELLCAAAAQTPDTSQQQVISMETSSLHLPPEVRLLQKCPVQCNPALAPGAVLRVATPPRPRPRRLSPRVPGVAGGGARLARHALSPRPPPPRPHQVRGLDTQKYLQCSYNI